VSASGLVERCSFPAAGTPVVCAVSGGADSLALLALAVEAGCAVTAIHVDHGVRPSDPEAAVVEDAARRFGARFERRHLEVDAGPNLEERWRDARRAALPPGALTGDPEPMKRRKVQTDALEQLARLESGQSEPVGARAARPHLTRLERSPDPEPLRAVAGGLAADKVAGLSDKQRELLQMVSSTPTVSEAAERLAVSRSNVYASLRRIARKLDVRSVPELVTMVRAGGLPD
jgi:DNA-binding CsgD family transcriptional regulator